MNLSISNSIIAVILSLSAFILGSCSHEEEIRTPDDILGVWSPYDDIYMEFSTENKVHYFFITEQDGMAIGDWDMEVYFYEPGYEIVLYINRFNEGTVYKVVSLTDSELVWCPVKEIELESLDKETVGKILGEIINEAQMGFHLDPALYQSFKKIPFDSFLSILESLDMFYPW